MIAREKLTDGVLDNVTGGTAYDRVAKTIGVDSDHLDYTYEDLDAVKAWIGENVRNFPPETREQDIIDGLLEATLIAPIA